MKKDYNPLTVCLCFLFLNILTCPLLFEHILLNLIYVHVVQHFKNKFCILPTLFCYSAEEVLCSVAEMCTVPCISLYSSVFVCTALYFSVLLCICSAAAMYLLIFALYLLCSCSVTALLCSIKTIS